MLAFAAFVFSASGFAALVYQVTWQRLLVIFSGADIYSATLVVAAFMVGLGCGTLAGGHIADRTTRVRSLSLFILVEAGVALFGAFSAFLFYSILYGRFGGLAVNQAVTAVVLFAGLLWPTLLMGMSLPLLARALVRRTDRAASTVGWLYAANTLGAAVGAAVATWEWLPQYGMEGTLRAAASLNALCAVGAVRLLAWARRSRDMESAAVEPSPAVGPSSGLPTWRWMAVYALAGFVALSLEIVWFRMLGVMLKSSAVTFGTLLSQYLLWLGLGSAAGSVFAGRVTRPARAFLWTQMAGTLYAALAVAVLVRELPDASSLAWLYEYLGSFEPVGQPFRRYVLLAAVVIGPATFLMGVGFPLLQRAVQTDLAHVGRRVGALLVANIAGSTAGTMITGWWLLGVFGTAGTIRVLVAASAAFGVLAVAAWARTRTRHALALPVLAVAAWVALLVPDGGRLWGVLHGSDPRRVIVGEDGSGVSLLKGNAGGFSGGITVFVNGLGQSWLPYGGIHSELGALPALLHAGPTEAAVVGLGSGDTLFALAGRRELQRIVSIEIVRPQLGTLQALLPLYPYGALDTWLTDPRIEQVFADGRAYIRRERRRFDILEADALRPTSAYAGNLYSDEYFTLMRDHLKPGGFAVTWVPTPRVQRTFLRVFPHAVRFGDILIGGTAPIPVDRDAVAARIADPEVQAYYARGGIDVRALLEPRLKNPVVFGMTDAERAAITDINTDLFPRDEFGR